VRRAGRPRAWPLAGNPFYLEELVSYVHSRGIDPADPAQLRGLDLPGSLHSLVLGRIDTAHEAPRAR